MYGSYAKDVMWSPDNDDAQVASTTALNYNEAIGVEKSTWIMPEPFTVTRFSILAITAITLTTAATVSLFRKARAALAVGADDTSSAAAFMTDSGETLTVNEFVGWTIYNITSKSSGVITANTATTVTASLVLDSDGVTADTWNSGDVYVIGYKLAEITIPIATADPAIGDVIYADVENTIVAGGGLTANDEYKTRGVADLEAGDQLAVYTTSTVGAGSAGTYQPYVFGHHRAEVAANQSKMTEST